MSKFPFGRSTAFHFFTQTRDEAERLRYHFQKLLKSDKIRHKTTPPVEEDSYQEEHTMQMPGSYSVSIYVDLPSTDRRYLHLIEHCQTLTDQHEKILGLDIDGCPLNLDHLREQDHTLEHESH